MKKVGDIFSNREYFVKILEDRGSLGWYCNFFMIFNESYVLNRGDEIIANARLESGYKPFIGKNRTGFFDKLFNGEFAQ